VVVDIFSVVLLFGFLVVLELLIHQMLKGNLLKFSEDRNLFKDL